MASPTANDRPAENDSMPCIHLGVSASPGAGRLRRRRIPPPTIARPSTIFNQVTQPVSDEPPERSWVPASRLSPARTAATPRTNPIQ